MLWQQEIIILTQVNFFELKAKVLNIDKFKNIHQLTSSLPQDKQVNIILTTNNAADTGDGEEENQSEEEPAHDLNDSCSTNDSVLDKLDEEEQR